MFDSAIRAEVILKYVYDQNPSAYYAALREAKLKYEAFDSAFVHEVVLDRKVAGSIARSIRKKHRIKYRELAAATGYSMAYIVALESGRKRWHGWMIQKFEAAIQKVLEERKRCGV